MGSSVPSVADVLVSLERELLLSGSALVAKFYEPISLLIVQASLQGKFSKFELQSRFERSPGVLVRWDRGCRWRWTPFESVKSVDLRCDPTAWVVLAPDVIKLEHSLSTFRDVSIRKRIC